MMLTRLLVLTLAALLLVATPAAADGLPPERLAIPSIGLDAPIVPVGWRITRQGSVWEVPDDAVGWHRTSARLGEPGNLVLSGHHNIKGMVFRRLKDVQVGDALTIYAGDVAYAYVVTERMILREAGQTVAQRLANARWIGPFDDERVTMVTCYPPWANTHRLVVVAKRADP